MGEILANSKHRLKHYLAQLMNWSAREQYFLPVERQCVKVKDKSMTLNLDPYHPIVHFQNERIV